MELPYQNIYEDVDGALEKTIRYRQMVGLLTSSAIRRYRTQQTSNATTTLCKRTNIANENVADKTKYHSKKQEVDLTSMNISTKSRRKNSISASDTNLAEEARSNLKSKNKHVPIAVDVIQYMFHNNNHNSDDVVENSHMNTLSSMKLQEKQRATPTIFKIRHHHPGYIPTTLWQIFNENEQGDKFKSTSQSASEDAVSHAIFHDEDEKHDIANCGTLQFLPTCFDCGGVIQPCVMNTTIRMVELKRKVNASNEMAAKGTDVASNVPSQLSRTQRRRESRFNAKLCRKQYYGSKEQHQQNSNCILPTHTLNHRLLQPHAKSNIWQYIWQQQNKYYHNQPTTTVKNLKSVYPFLNCCTHYFILTCGSCGARIFLPDFHNNNTKSLNIRNKKSNERTKQFQRNHSVRQNHKSGTKNEQRQILSPLSDKSAETIFKETDKNQIFCEAISNTENPALLDTSICSLQANISTTSINLSHATIGMKRKESDAQHNVETQVLDLVTVQPTAATILLHPQRKKKKAKNIQGKNEE